MLALISPAKKLNLDPAPVALPHSQPILLDQTETLVKTTRRLSRKKLRELMRISADLAELNWQRFQDFETPLHPGNAKQAALMFAGDTYVGLDAGTLDADDLGYAQAHLGILSGFYGVLRPLDLIQPYRLEMGSALKTRRGSNLYAFWGGRISDAIGKLVDGHADPTIINLASNEYFKAVKTDTLPGPVVTPTFMEDKDGQLKTISFLAKKARGMMARFMITNRIEDPEGLKRFDVADYAFKPELSDETRWVFSRPWRSAKAA